MTKRTILLVVWVLIPIGLGTFHMDRIYADGGTLNDHLLHLAAIFGWSQAGGLIYIFGLPNTPQNGEPQSERDKALVSLVFYSLIFVALGLFNIFILRA